MSSTRCEKCNGWGTICKRCGRPRRRKLSKWYSSNGCGCYRARLERCPEHKPSTWSCDICGVTKVAVRDLTKGVAPVSDWATIGEDGGAF